MSDESHKEMAGATLGIEALEPVTLTIELSQWHLQFVQDWLAYDGLLLGVATPEEAVERFLSRALTAVILQSEWSTPNRAGISGFPADGVPEDVGIVSWQEGMTPDDFADDDYWDGEDVPF